MRPSGLAIRLIPLRRWFFDIKQKYVRIIIGLFLLIAANLLKPIGKKTSALRCALAAHRLLYSAAAFRAVLRNLSALKDAGDALVSSGVTRNEAVIRTIVTQWPALQDRQIVEKGILIITFTKVCSYYYRNINIESLAKYFHIVLEPSWSGYMDADILFWTTKTEQPIFVQSSEIRDRVALECLCSNLVPISIGASDWVDHGRFTPNADSKIYDSVYVANTSPVKRIHIYLKAIKKIIEAYDRNYKAVLVCAAWGGKAAEIQALINYYGIAEHCRLELSLSQEQLSQLLNTCKVNVLMSLKEGSNRSLFESMFCNLPVIALADNIGVNKAYINEYTGALIYEDQLSEVLVQMAKTWGNYQPRQWALKNISPEATTKKLAAIIKARVPGGPAESSSPMLIKTNNPEVSYLEYPTIERADIMERLLNAFSLGSLCDISHELAQCQNDFMRRITTAGMTNSKADNSLYP
ncbi:MAG TPA: glycosyltransferase [Spongiibacteraceae bacterium]|nr:glycosyltransferase [Spongiibacteraceae bacterium]